ncbi:virulence-associated E family protein [Ruminococcus sp.]|uniref:virulence-associated E family protein n=1 Tax=Ruminococcus sp. TaxID=41978 RepID=UPI0025CE2765|nr:virulence-associated E family protein [Ruminococcus sp.]
MQNDRRITITIGSSRKATQWNAQQMLWSELVAKLATPMRGTETLEEYLKLSKPKQDSLKDVGGFVAGTLEGKQRKASAVVGRDVVTLDMDSIAPGGTQEVLRRIDGLNCTYCVYSTRKHSEAAPRLRVLIPLSRTCTADEYEPIARKLAEFAGMKQCDQTTFEASRLMYWPSCCADSTYIYTYSDKYFADTDGILGMYADWRDVKQWPGLTAPKIPRGTKQADPTEKHGVVGAFCRIYDVYKVIAEILPDKYIVCDTGDRYTYAGGTTTGGAVVYEGGKFLFSHHAHDPAGGKLCNAFDLMRLHLFGDKDDDAKPDTPTNKLPSYTAACEYAVKDAGVAQLMMQEQYAVATAAFGTAVPADNADWMQLLEVDSNGKSRKTTDNILIILENDPGLKGKFVFEEFSNRILCMGALPWDNNPETRDWKDNDDAGLRYYLEKVYTITGKARVDDAMSVCCHRNKINAVQDYLRGLPEWDGTPRVETLFIEYLGAADCIYTRAVARTSLTAAVARAMLPGVKYDYMPVLAGPQGLGKSTLLRLLAPKWFNDSLTTFDGKDAYETIQGSWIMELAELVGMSKADDNKIKQFLSKQEDIFREPYGRRTGRYPRRCVFFGTTNEEEFLRDHTGNRRFWPVECGVQMPMKSVFTELAENVPQIWAEALVMWRNGEKLYLPPELEAYAKQAQEEHSEHSAKEGIIRDFLNRDIPVDWEKRSLGDRKMYWSGEFANDRARPELKRRERVCAVEIWCEAFGGEIRYFKRSDAAEINAILARIPGWVKCKSNIRFGNVYGAQKGFIRLQLSEKAQPVNEK